MTPKSGQGYVLDTGIANLIAREDNAALQWLAQVSLAYIPLVVIGELYYGAYRYAQRHQSTKFLDMYDTFCSRYRRDFLAPDEETTRIYAAIYAELQSKGMPIQQNDCWIAALARQRGLIIATVDSDLLRVSGVTVELW